MTQPVIAAFMQYRSGQAAAPCMDSRAQPAATAAAPPAAAAAAPFAAAAAAAAPVRGVKNTVLKNGSKNCACATTLATVSDRQEKVAVRVDACRLTVTLGRSHAAVFHDETALTTTTRNSKRVNGCRLAAQLLPRNQLTKLLLPRRSKTRRRRPRGEEDGAGCGCSRRSCCQHSNVCA